MSFMRYLGNRPGDSTAATSMPADLAGETEAVRSIVSRLHAMPLDKARSLAGMAYVLARAANANLVITDVETTTMETELAAVGLDQAQAVLVVEMAKFQAMATGATSDYLVTREFSERATPDERLGLLRACYHIAAADDSIDAMENATLDEIANELGLTHDDVAPVRADFAAKLSARLGNA